MKNSETRELLKKHFGHDSLRSGQSDVIERVIGGVNTLAVLPTGGGKSLCYQLPAVVLGGLTVVISPLIALMRDQVEVLIAKGISAARLDSSGSSDEQEQVLTELKARKIKLLYLSPERLADAEVQGVLRELNIDLVAIDEAHCVSEWGHSFRPAYLRLPKLVRRLKPRGVLALTATASPAVAGEIRKAFGILKRNQVQTSFHRENLHFHVTACVDDDKDQALLEALSLPSRLPAIVYATRRETVESLATLLRQYGIRARAYHAGMGADARSEVQDGFVGGRFDVICATIAFGMGVDMAGVRSVIHYQPPKSPEGWMQESGRAGRDGAVSHCELLVSGNDRMMLEGFVLAQKPTLQAVENVLAKIFSQGPRAVVSRYDLCSINDIPWALLDILFARLEMQGWIVPEQGSWLWCHAVPLAPVEQVLYGFKPAQQKVLRPILESRQRVSLMETSGGSASAQMKLMGLLAELNATAEVRMKFSHSLHHFRVRKQPQNLVGLAETMYEVFEDHARRELLRIDSVINIATSSDCIAAGLLTHFGESLNCSCGNCSSCMGLGSSGRLPLSPVDEVTEEELMQIQSIASERKPALASPERLARFFCGIYSPGMMRYRLYQRSQWGVLKRLPYDEVLAYARAQIY